MVFRKIQNYYKYAGPLYCTDKFGNRSFILQITVPIMDSSEPKFRNVLR